MNTNRQSCKRLNIVALITVIIVAFVAVPITPAVTGQPWLKTDTQVEPVVEPVNEQAKSKTVIEIAARFFLVPIDSNEVTNFLEKESLEVAPIDSEPNLTHCLLNAEQVDRLLKLLQKIPGAGALASPKISVFDSEKATRKVQKTIDYISGYTEPNLLSDEPEPKRDSVTKGIQFIVTPKLQPDDKDILLKLDLEVSDVLGFEKRTYKQIYTYEIPKMEIVTLKTFILVPNGQTLVISGQRIKSKNKQDDRIIQKNLLVLIRAERVGKLAIGREKRMKPATKQKTITKSIGKQLKEDVDLSPFSVEMSFGDAIEVLKYSVEPPLNIVVLWRDLYDNADIDRTTPINMDAISAVPLGTALKLLLKSVSGRFAELDYVIKDGLVIIATKQTLPEISKMKTQFYDTGTLLGEKADYRVRQRRP